MRSALLACLLLTACPPASNDAAGVDLAAAPSSAEGVLSGMVMETMNAAGYTYVRLQTPQGDEEWAAINETPMKVGDRVQINDVTWQHDFHSNTLDRTFAEIAFGQIGEVSASGNPHLPSSEAHASHPLVSDPPAGGSGMTNEDADAMMAAHGTAAAPAVDAPIAKAEGPGAHTVAEVFGGKAKLAGKPVTLRAKVVKSTLGVMNANWLHLQDGSGSAATHDHDLTVTTADVANVGEVIVVTDTVATDKDLGAGYKYDVLLENAKIVR